MNACKILMFPVETSNKPKPKKICKYQTTTNISNQKDLQKILEYFQNEGKHIHKLIFVLSLAFGRRISDTLNFRWCDFYNLDGTKKQYLVLNEKKTSKNKKLIIPQVVFDAFREYCDHFNFIPSDYLQNYVALQLSGTHKGKNLSYEAYRQALKQACKSCNIQGNISTHSTRKTFGYMGKKLHPTDEFSTSVISGLLNHSSEAITRNYIGLNQEQEDAYITDFGNMLSNLMQGKQTQLPEQATDLMTIEYDKIRQIVQFVYQLGRENANTSDLDTHLNSIDFAMELLRDEQI